MSGLRASGAWTLSSSSACPSKGWSKRTNQLPAFEKACRHFSEQSRTGCRASLAFLRCTLLEQVRHQVIKVHLRNLIDKIGRHWRKLRHRALFYRILGYADFLPLCIREHVDLAFFPQNESGHALPTLERKDCGTERLIDVAIRIENIFQQTIDAAYADTVELRADLCALAAELMAIGAVLLVNLRTQRRIGLRGCETGFTAFEKLLHFLIGRRQAFGQFRNPLFQVRYLGLPPAHFHE